MANRDSAQTGVRTQSSAESRQPTPTTATAVPLPREGGSRAQSYAESRQPTPTAVSHGTSLKREANDTPTPTTQKRQFTYDDYITATAAEKAKGMLGRYFKTGEIPSNLSTSLKERLSGNSSPSLAGGVANATGGVANRAASNTGNSSPSLAGGVARATGGVANRAASNTGNASLILAKPDYSSPTAAWRTPETFQAIPWSDFGSLNKYDRKAYLKAYAENSQREKAQRDAMAQAEAQRLNQERSDKMLADHFYGRMLKGEQIDVKVLEPKTLGALQDRAYEDYSKGAISYDQYIDLPIHVFKSLDNGQTKVYNGNTDNSTMPLMQTSGFDRYRTERYDYVPQKNNQTSLNSNNMAIYGEYKDVISKAMSKINYEIASSSKRSYFSDDFISATEDAFSKIITAIENGTPVEPFMNGTKVRIDIVEDYNSSGLELFMEVAGLFPYVGEFAGIVDYASEEDADPQDLLGSLSSFILEGDFKNLSEMLNDPFLSDALKFAGYFSTASNLLDIVETIKNFDSPDKKGTGISILVQDGNYGYYQYDAYVDKNLNFKVFGAYYTPNIEFIKGNEFEISKK